MEESRGEQTDLKHWNKEDKYLIKTNNLFSLFQRDLVENAIWPIFIVHEPGLNCRYKMAGITYPV